MANEFLDINGLAHFKDKIDQAHTQELDTALAGKQDVIQDLDAIRAGATAGATAYQKPVGGIPASDLASGVIPDVSGFYEKPSTGIPETDLSEAVRTSLGKADTALQSFTETDPTVPAWAKASSKPSYTAAEVGALPDDTEIPSALSDLSADSTHRLVTDTEKATWNSKQDAISDLETIRSGAAAGATAYQKPATGIPASDINTADIDGVSIFPDMDSLTPVQTIEYDIANNRWNKLFERANPSGIVASAVAGTVACRLTVTGTGMTDKQVTDLVFILPGKANQTNLFFTYSRTPDTSAPANYGIYMLRGYWAKTLGDGYGWGVDFNVYGSNLPRHLKVEIFKLPNGVSFSSQETASTSSTSYQSFTSNYNLSWFQSFQGMPFDISGQANRALYVSSFLPVSPGSAYHIAGEALAADNLVFQASDSKFYKVSTTNKIINTDASILLTGATASGATIGYAYLRVLSGATAFSSTSATYGSFAKGDEIFLRCTNSNGSIYSDGVLTNAVSAGHTWISIGWAVSATQLALNTAGKVFFTLDANGKLTHINGREIAGGSAGGGEAYWATVGTTPYADVKAAYDSGKPVFAINSSGYAFVLNYANSSSLYFSCLAMDEHKGYYAYVNSNGWTTGNADIYSKPSGGIPKTDLASAVQTSLGLADTAVQPEAGKGLFSGNYNDLSNKPTIPTVPTIDTSIDNASSNTDTAGAKAVYDAVHPAAGSSQPAGGMLPNRLYKLGTLTGSVTFSLATPADANIANHYYWTFDAGSTAPTITWPTGITWAGGSAPAISANKHYEISVLDNYGIYVEV